MEINPKYLISTTKLVDAFENSKYKGVNDGIADAIMFSDGLFSLKELAYFEISFQEGKFYLSNLIPEIKKNFSETDFFFTDISHRLFLPVLVNYIALVDYFRIEEYLDYYFELLDSKKLFTNHDFIVPFDIIDTKIGSTNKTGFVYFIVEHHNYVVKQFSYSLLDDKQRILMIKYWADKVLSKILNQDSKSNNDTDLDKNENKIFDLTDDKISIVVKDLLDEKIISETEVLNVKGFLQNDFNNSLKLKADLKQVTELLKRLIENSHKEDYKHGRGDKKKFARILENKIFYYKTEIFKPIIYNTLKKHLTDNNLIPKTKLVPRLLPI